VVGGKQAEHRIWILTKQQKCGQSDRGSRVAADGLGDDLIRGKFRKLTQNSGAQVVISNDPETARCGQWGQARDGLLDHGVLAIKREELLGAALSAQRPEARASAAGQDYRTKMRVRSHVVASLTFT
jgi:hypothetical protein